jgi:hypothetical protein
MSFPWFLYSKDPTLVLPKVQLVTQMTHPLDRPLLRLRKVRIVSG